MAWTTPSTAVAGSTALTAAFWNEQVRDNSLALYNSIQRLGFQSITSNYNANQTSVASAADMFTDITFTADGTSTYIIEFFSHRCESATNAGSWIRGHLVDGSGNDLGHFGYVGYGDGTRQGLQMVYARFGYTPAAGSRSVNIRWIYSGAAGIVYAGAGGSGAALPTTFAVYGPILT